MESGVMKRYKKRSSFTQLDNTLLQSIGEVSFSTIGLISYMCSMPDKWKFYKTWIYKKAKDGRSRIDRCWKEAVDKNYILQFKKRVGNRNTYTYYVNDTPFSREEVEEVSEYEGVQPVKSLSEYSPAQVKSMAVEDSQLPTWLLDGSEEQVEDDVEQASTEETSEDATYNYHDDEIISDTATLDDQKRAQSNLDTWKRAEELNKESTGEPLSPINMADMAKIKYAVIMTHMVFSTDTLLTQFKRFNKVFRSDGIGPKNIVTYFMRGLHQLESFAMKDLRDVTPKDRPEIPMHNWTKNADE